MVETLADALPKEIKRVRDLQEQYKYLRQFDNVIVEPQIQMMENAIQAATKAAANGDAVAMLRSQALLKTFEE